MHATIRRETHVDAFKACFHRQDEDRGCRKPKPGTILEVISILGINLSFMVKTSHERRSRRGARPAVPAHPSGSPEAASYHSKSRPL
jgi:hypothetical protein